MPGPLAAALAGGLLFSPAAVQQGAAPPSPPLAIPREKLTARGIESIRQTGTFVVPSLLLHVALDGPLPAGGPRPAPTYRVSGLQKTWLQALARELHHDLAERLRARGFVVLSYPDVAANRALRGMARLPADRIHRLPYRRDSTGRAGYLVAAPSDAQALRTDSGPALEPFRRLARALQAAVLLPELWVAAPQVWDSGGGRRGSVSAVVNLAPGLDLAAARIWVISDSGRVAALRLEGPVADVVKETGLLLLAREDPDTGARRARRPGLYQLRVDSAAYALGVRRAGLSLNRTLAEVLGLVARVPP